MLYKLICGASVGTLHRSDKLTAVCIMVEAGGISKKNVHLFKKSSPTKIEFYLNNEASY
jgi:hypothetical protein